jgi:hypothetical protein
MEISFSSRKRKKIIFTYFSIEDGAAFLILTVDQFLNSSLIQAGGREALPSRLFPAGEKY